jgi:hypothetical protein
MLSILAHFASSRSLPTGKGQVASWGIRSPILQAEGGTCLLPQRSFASSATRAKCPYSTVRVMVVECDRAPEVTVSTIV